MIFMISVGNVFFIISIVLFYLSMIFYYYNYLILYELNILYLSGVDYTFYILLDWISLSFMSLILFISFCVYWYSVEYMLGSKMYKRFIGLLFLFILSMLFMVMSPMCLSIMLGWDGLGLISFLLILYYQNYNSYKSGMLTVIMNRFGDSGLMMSIALGMIYGGWVFDFFNVNYMIIIFLMISAMVKSAQFPFSSWLPAAMAAPTPVSALVHSSTLVTAGIYLLIRFYDLLMLSQCSKILLVLSLFTAFLSGLSAMFEMDMKKIIALSTLSQLSFMMVILCSGSWKISYFHLFIHALFKSLLFLCVGKIIHHSYMDQDIRKMGGLIYYYPVTVMIMVSCLLSLGGFPFMCGFYSKDMILEYFFSKMYKFVIYLMMFSSVLTVSYSIRLIMYLMFNQLKNKGYLMIHSENNFMLIPMIILFIFTVIGGSMMYWLMFFDIEFIEVNLSEKFYLLMNMFYGLLLIYYVINIDMYKYISYNSNYYLKYSTLFYADLFIELIIMKLFNLSFYCGELEDQWVEFFGKKSFVNLLMLNNYFMKFNMFNFINFFTFIFLMILMFICL